jgi:hypothetical protein
VTMANAKHSAEDRDRAELSELRAKVAELEAKYNASQKAAGLAGNRNIELGRENIELHALVRDLIGDLVSSTHYSERSPRLSPMIDRARALGVKL